jgi:hypothetical protein
MSIPRSLIVAKKTAATGVVTILISAVDLRQSGCIVGPFSRQELQDVGELAQSLLFPRLDRLRWFRRMFGFGPGTHV